VTGSCDAAHPHIRIALGDRLPRSLNLAGHECVSITVHEQRGHCQLKPPVTEEKVSVNAAWTYDAPHKTQRAITVSPHVLHVDVEELVYQSLRVRDTKKVFFFARCTLIMSDMFVCTIGSVH
jgi:hypothetical protein